MQPDIQRLIHIRDYCGMIENTVSRFGGTFEVFARDGDFQQSIAFSILQIGELAGGLSDALREVTADEINWSYIRGMRNIIAHHYGKIDLEIVWSTITEDIPRLKAFCEKHIAD